MTRLGRWRYRLVILVVARLATLCVCGAARAAWDEKHIIIIAGHVFRLALLATAALLQQALCRSCNRDLEQDQALMNLECRILHIECTDSLQRCQGFWRGKMLPAWVAPAQQTSC